MNFHWSSDTLVSVWEEGQTCQTYFLAPGRLSSGQRGKRSHCRHGERPSTPPLGKGLLSSCRECDRRQPPTSCPFFPSLSSLQRDTLHKFLSVPGQGRVWAQPRHPNPTLDKWLVMQLSCFLRREGHGGHEVTSPNPAVHLPFHLSLHTLWGLEGRLRAFC